MSPRSASLHVLVTGGAGYLGSILVGTLLEAGHRVTVLDRLLYGQNTLFHHCANPRFEFVLGDARDEALMRRLVATADVIIPLAAVVGATACDRDPWMATSVNLEAVQMLNRLRSRTQLVVYPNTNSGYGTQTGEQFCTEETPLEPITHYGITKVKAELELLESENVITLRLATVFGMSPRMRLDLLVNHFTWAAMFERYIVIFEKDFKRNYIHVRDVADAFLHCITHPEKMVGRPHNAGLDEANLSKEELALLVKRYFPDFYIHFGEVGSDPDKRNYIVSNQRLREAGFEAKRSIDDGVVELIKGYRMLGRPAFKNA
jgi:nucleoside-diphosphate-sugar epimerase